MPNNLNGVGYSVFGTNRRFDSSIWGRGRLDIYALWLIKHFLQHSRTVFSFNVENISQNDDS